MRCFGLYVEDSESIAAEIGIQKCSIVMARFRSLKSNVVRLFAWFNAVERVKGSASLALLYRDRRSRNGSKRSAFVLRV